MISSIEHVVRSTIVAKVNKSKFFSVMADETTDAATKEQVAICLRYLEQTDNGTMSVNEDFVGFVEVDVANAENIARVLLKSMKEWGLDCTKLRGQGYDGASVMMGQISGVQARVKEVFPKAKYLTHCANHKLNLVIIASCTSVADIRNFMNSLQKLSFFFAGSAKRKAILTRHMAGNGSGSSVADILTSDIESSNINEMQLQYGAQRHSLPTLSDTRWMAIESIQ